MNRRLPAEVVARRRPNKAPKVEEQPKPVEEVEVELKAALAIKPDARLKWLKKAFRMVEEGYATASDLYSVVASRKFAAGLPARVGRKLKEILHGNLDIFSDKQRRFLKSRECPLVSGFPDVQKRKRSPEESDDDEADAAAKMEEMMARCRAFVREKADTFEERAAECAALQHKREEEANEAREREHMWARDSRSRQRIEEAEAAAVRAELEAAERVRREKQEAEERVAREAREAEERAERQAREAEEARRRALAEEMAIKRRLEDEVDSSMLLLERVQKRAPAPQAPVASAPPPKQEKAARGLSRSRSISAGSSSSTTSRRSRRSRHSRRSRSRKSRRSRSRGRRRRKTSSSSSRRRDRKGRRPRSRSPRR